MGLPLDVGRDLMRHAQHAGTLGVLGLVIGGGIGIAQPTPKPHTQIECAQDVTKCSVGTPEEQHNWGIVIDAAIGLGGGIAIGTAVAEAKHRKWI